jgi:hypothetical protein
MQWREDGAPLGRPWEDGRRRWSSGSSVVPRCCRRVLLQLHPSSRRMTAETSPAGTPRSTSRSGSSCPPSSPRSPRTSCPPSSPCSPLRGADPHCRTTPRGTPLQETLCLGCRYIVDCSSPASRRGGRASPAPTPRARMGGRAARDRSALEMFLFTLIAAFLFPMLQSLFGDVAISVCKCCMNALDHVAIVF